MILTENIFFCNYSIFTEKVYPLMTEWKVLGSGFSVQTDVLKLTYLTNLNGWRFSLLPPLWWQMFSSQSHTRWEVPLTLSFLIQLQFREKKSWTTTQARHWLVSSVPFGFLTGGGRWENSQSHPVVIQDGRGFFPVALLRCRANWQTAATPSHSSTVCFPDGGQMYAELCWFESLNLIPEHIGDCPTAMPMCLHQSRHSA